MINQKIDKSNLWNLKLKYLESIQNLTPNDLEHDEKDFIKLFHGTTTSYLYSILNNGLLPRKETGISNWKSKNYKDEMITVPTESASNLVYLTNKWHYFYAVDATMKYQLENNGENWYKDEQLFFSSIPCYIECWVPKGLLVADEDIFITNYVRNKVKKCLKNNNLLHIDANESLAQYGTVGVVGGIKKEWIKSFTVIAEMKMLYDLVFNEKSSYIKDYKKWQEGKGNLIKLEDLLKRETESNLNLTWYLENLPKPIRPIRFGLNQITQKLSLQYL